MKRFLALLALVQAGTDAEVKKAEARLAEAPDDPVANLTVGRSLIAKGDADKAIPFLLKCSDASLKAAAKAEGVAEGKAAIIALDAGDLWTRAMEKQKPIRQACLDRASSWYAKAWPDLDDLYKMKLRERLAKLYVPPGPSRAKLPEGWTGDRFSVASTRVHSGGGALRVSVNRDGNGLADLGGFEQTIPKGKSFEFSAWVSSENTVGLGDKLQVEIRNSQRKAIWLKEYFISQDLPVWVKVGDKGDFPEGAVTLKIGVLADSTKGTLWVDDVSLRMDGKEVLKGGNFE